MALLGGRRPGRAAACHNGNPVNNNPTGPGSPTTPSRPPGPGGQTPRRGSLFTGIGYEDAPGIGLSEISYRYGVQEGPARDWYPSGALKGESHFRANVLHGVAREYAEDGTLIEESFYEYGILVERRERAASGEMLTTFALNQDSPSYNLLERYRREKGWPVFE